MDKDDKLLWESYVVLEEDDIQYATLDRDIERYISLVKTNPSIAERFNNDRDDLIDQIVEALESSHEFDKQVIKNRVVNRLPLNEAEQIALPGMQLPDAREGQINILINQLVPLYAQLYQDKNRVVQEIIDSLKKSDIVEYNEKTDLHLVIGIVNKKMPIRDEVER